MWQVRRLGIYYRYNFRARHPPEDNERWIYELLHQFSNVEEFTLMVERLHEDEAGLQLTLKTCQGAHSDFASSGLRWDMIVHILRESYGILRQLLIPSIVNQPGEAGLAKAGWTTQELQSQG